ncbi:MAG: DUF4157 domain-containing protein [bacterium]|nr:DUF4157 domain-containing protein [bacterium]
MLSYSPLEQQSKHSASVHLYSAEPLHGDQFKAQSLTRRAHRAMERLSGIDLSSLRIHAESPLPATFGARAFVCGDQIHFAPGEYDPSTSEGWRVLGHEIAHVVQQRLGRVTRRPNSGSLLVSDPALEAEADSAGDYAAQMFADEDLPCRPLHRGVSVPSSAIGEVVVQCLMTVDQFKAVTPGGMRNKIRTVDSSLAEYHKLNFGPMTARNFQAALTQLRALYQCCNAYKMTRGTRGQGVDNLIRQIALEEVVLVSLAAYHKEADPVKKLDHLEQAQEYALQMRSRPDFTWQGGSLTNDITNDLMTPLINILRGSGATIEAVVRRDLEALTVLPAQRLTMPQILKDVIREVTQRDYVADSLTLGIGGPAGAYNKRKGATTRFILSHGPQNLGRKFRMGALLHEMTHLSNADYYGNTVFMFSIPVAATDAEMLARARTRRGKLESVIAGFGSDYAIGEELRKEIVEKCKYPIGGKFGNVYLGKMIEMKLLTDAEKVRYKQLNADGMDSELIEYDSVINQTALWCELSGVSQSNANFANLLNLVGEAHALRTSRS